VVASFGILYNKWELKYLEKEQINYNANIKNFLLNRKTISDYDLFSKPFIWIHVDNELNTRNWESFNSRSNKELNKPYMVYTIKSIIKKCDKTFNVCLIDDSSFEKLLDDWTIDFSRLDITMKNKVRTLAICKLLHTYGGINVPPSFLCNRNLKDMYYKNINSHGMFACEKLDVTSYNTQTRFLPDCNFIGCKRNNNHMLEFSRYLEVSISNDYTSESNFTDNYNKYLSNMVNDGYMSLIDGRMIGIKNANNHVINIDDLFNTKFIDFVDNYYGIYIPDNMISKRTNYNWFLKINLKDLLESDMIISKFLLVSNE
tara:strand:+ start:406 stop:1350 length:945 start_codon:yes stop_codon:yes gene_type:complete